MPLKRPSMRCGPLSTRCASPTRERRAELHRPTEYQPQNDRGRMCRTRRGARETLFRSPVLDMPLTRAGPRHRGVPACKSRLWRASGRRFQRSRCRMCPPSCHPQRSSLHGLVWAMMRGMRYRLCGRSRPPPRQLQEPASRTGQLPQSSRRRSQGSMDPRP